MPVRGRMLSNTLGASRKFNRLANHDHRLMYVLMIPHADAEGRLDADARILGGKAFTLLDFTPEAIDLALRDMDAVGLITLYEVDGERYLEISGFHEHQTIRRKKDGAPLHEAPSRIPPIERSGNVGDQSNVVATVVPRWSHGGPTVEPRWEYRGSHGGPTDTSAHQYKAIQSKDRGDPPTGVAPLHPALSDEGAAAASGDAPTAESKNVDFITGEIHENRRPLPDVILAYADRKRRERDQAPAPITWTPQPKPEPTQPDEEIIF